MQDKDMLEWTETISVNNTHIDKQHQMLFKLTNRLIEHTNANVNSAIISETLNDLLKYTQTHFDDEEELLEQHDYPKLEEHKQEHEDFMYKVTMFCNDVVNRKETVPQELIAFLVEWLKQHTAVNDQDYKKYI